MSDVLRTSTWATLILGLCAAGCVPLANQQLGDGDATDQETAGNESTPEQVTPTESGVGDDVPPSLGVASSQSPDLDADGDGTVNYRAAFRDPPMSVRPLIRWWWPGGAVEVPELARELQSMRGAGLGGVEIQSFAVGLPPDVTPQVFTYGSPEWYDRVSFVLRHASTLGMTVDLTLGSAWPSGGAHIDASDSLQQLLLSVETIDGPVRYERPPPGVDRTRILCVDRGPARDSKRF